MTDEEKRANFERIATKRVNAIIGKINSLKALTNKSFYLVKDEDLKKITKAIEEANESLKDYYFNSKRRFKL